MVVNCEHVWQEISNYLEGEVNPELRAAMEAHFRECRHCTAVLDGTRNVMHLYADDRAIELPAGFTARWQNRLAESMPSPRGTAYGWLVAVAAVALISGSFALARLDSSSPFALALLPWPTRDRRSARNDGEVAADGKTFHVPGCRYLHKHERTKNVRLIAASEAIREGYVPCVRCLRQYLNR